jgi:ABC-type antimicrobial peptide transport system permease subunit
MIETGFPRVRVARAETMSEALGASIQWRHFQTWLFTALGAAGLGGAGAGILGLVAMSVARRSREVGVRMALGATRSTVIQQMLAEQLPPVGFGLVAGGILAAGTLRFVQQYAYKLSVNDPRIWMTAFLVIVTAAVIGSLAPVLRATRVDPVSALRVE